MGVRRFLAGRLKFRSESRRNITAGVGIAVGGVALAVAVLELTIAIVAGFKAEITNKVTAFDSQISVLPAVNYQTSTQEPMIWNSEEVVGILTTRYPEAKVETSVRQPAMLKTSEDFAGIFLTGYDTEKSSAFESLEILEGELPDFSSSKADTAIILSSTTANQLRLSVGEKISVSFFVDGEVKLRRPVIVAIYTSNIAEYDKNVGFVSGNMLRKVLGVDQEAASTVEVRGLKNISPDDIVYEAVELQKFLISENYAGRIGSYYLVNNVVNSAAMYFNWLSLLDTNIVVIIALMLCVAGFTLISSLYLIVLERREAASQLRIMGASRGIVASVFSLLGLKIVFRGLLLGNALGLGIILLQHYFRFIPLDPEMYYLNFVPASLEWLGFLWVNLGAVAASWLVLMLPARSAARSSLAVQAQ